MTSTDQYGVGPLRREMSEFHARELLLPYLEGQLPEDTRRAVEKTMERYPRLKQELEALRAASSYVEKLSTLKLARQHVEALLEDVGLWTRISLRLAPRHWPDGLKIATEAALVLATLFLVGVLVPWDLVKEKVDIFTDSGSTAVVRPETLPAPAPVAVPAPEPPPVATLESTEELEAVALSGPEVEVDEDLDAPAAEETVAQAPSEPAPPKPAPATARRGEVFKLFMDLSNLDVMTPEIADRIRELGGVKAGQVPLGWRRTNGSYFHFSIDEENYGALETMLREYAPLRILRDPHNRVMPEGVRRVILWIERVPTSSQPSVEKEVSSEEEINPEDTEASTVDYD